jgi:hypothetical protein
VTGRTFCCLGSRGGGTVNSCCSHAMVSTLRLMLTAQLLFSVAHAQVSDSERRHEESDIAKLAAITRADHSSIFFHGLTKSGYVRDGNIHIVALKRVDERSHLHCGGDAASREGTRIAYVTETDDAKSCHIVVRDLKSEEDRELTNTEVSRGILSWSWDDKEIAYEGGRKLNALKQENEEPGAVVAVSLADGRQRTISRLPLRINKGKPPGEIGNLLSLDWLHQRPELVAEVDICVPIRDPWPGTCQGEVDILLLSSDDNRVLAVGRGAAVSPAGDHIGFVTKDGVWVIDADGSNRRRIASIPPAAFFLPFFKEETGWSEVVWSPSGDRLWFNTIIGEEFFNNYYLVDLKSGKRRQVLKNSLLGITAWRR